mgnify:CR=1 FL=1
MLRIGQFSKLARVTIKTLRYYDKIGLLKPAMTDKSSSYRYYDEGQLRELCLILSYKDSGLSNDLILKILKGEENERSALEYQRALLLEREAQIKQSISALDGILNNDGGQDYSATLKKIGKRLVYCCRGYVRDSGSIHDFIRACGKEFSRTNPDIKPSEPDYCCIIYPDDGYRESNIFVEYAQSVERKGVETEILKFKELEEITAISVLHRGSYDTLRSAYLFAVKWEQGYELCSEPRERYIDGAWNKNEVCEWLTELQLPVRLPKEKTDSE